MKKIIIVISITLICAVSIAGSRYRVKGTTVKDKATGLTWQRCTAGKRGKKCQKGKGKEMPWKKAKSYCKKLKLSGKKWRLPTVYELRTIVDRSQYKPAINRKVFPNTESSLYWSSSVDVFYSVFAWRVWFDFGIVYHYYKAHKYFVRCVSGP